MNFVSPLFLYFLIVLFCVRWFLFPSIMVLIELASSENKTNSTPPKEEISLFGRRFSSSYGLLLLLLLGSYLFYASWDFRFLGLILLTSLYDFYFGIKIGSVSKNWQRKTFLFLSIFLNLSILGFFKYSSFFLENFIYLGSFFGFNFSPKTWNILLPAGISFYTFQSISYTVDVYRNILSPEKNFFRYALFLAFFPQLVAGPIVMAKDFLPQITNLAKQKFSQIPLNKAFYFVLIGFVKKSVIADNISLISDSLFSNSSQIQLLSWVYIGMGMVAYSIQIYGDFSGYTDIARGVALLFGFSLPENFNLPYFANSLTDFWRRWHISLSSWLRSYLYIPMGGNRGTEFNTYRNLFLTMFLGGLWHGASWNFVIWGSLHGIYLGFERWISKQFSQKFSSSDVRPSIQQIGKTVYLVFTFFLVTCFWVFFRSANFPSAISILKGILTMQPGIRLGYSFELQFYSIFFLVLVGHCIGYFYETKIQEMLEKKTSYGQYVFCAVLVILAVLYSGELKPFIYFVF